MRRWLVSVALAGFFVVNVTLALIGKEQAAEKQQLLQEHGHLVQELARAQRNLERVSALLPDADADTSLIPEEYSIAVVHASPGCGKVAFYRKPGPERVSALARLPNGTKPVTNSPIICGHCGRAAWPLYERARVLPPR